MSGNSDKCLTIRGTIECVHYAGPTFSAGRLRDGAGILVPFAGRLYARMHEPVTLRGRWTMHPRYGRQFEVEGMELDLDLDVEGLAHYLANHPDIRGIGPVRARIIAERFGGDLEHWLHEAPAAIAQAARVPLHTILDLERVWMKTLTVNRAVSWLAAFGLTHRQVTTLVEKCGNNIVGILKADPYLLVREVQGLGFRRVDQIALRMGVPKEDESRIRAGVAHCMDEALDEGDCWVDYQDLVDRANGLLIMDVLDSKERIEKVLDQMIQRGDLASPSYGGRFLVARPHMLARETFLAQVFQQGGRPSPHFTGSEDLRRIVAAAAPELNEGQAEAVRNALAHSISLISGGAGSGKTHSVAAIERICRARGLRVALAAPTGKAAKRLEQVVGCPASTIHRLLGYNGTTYARDELNPIEADIVVTDEASMIDIPLAWRLFQAIRPERTAVVLVGDHHQLPPIGPGNPLRDLIDTRVLPTVVLDKIVRQSGTLKANSMAILEGEVRKTSEREASGRRAWYVADQFDDPLEAQGFLMDLFEKALSERLHFDLLREVQVLTPTHKGPLGTVELNRLLQRLIQKKLWKVDVPEVPDGRRPKFLLHDRVVQTRNNYRISVMNGAQGHVTSVNPDRSLTIDFDGIQVVAEPGSQELRDVALAYALSVHRSQGSEFPCVVIVAHKSHSFMHHRNLLYTAVTRATQTVVLIGDRWGMRNCAAKVSLDKRRTFIPLLLAEGTVAQGTLDARGFAAPAVEEV